VVDSTASQHLDLDTVEQVKVALDTGISVYRFHINIHNYHFHTSDQRSHLGYNLYGYPGYIKVAQDIYGQ